MFTAGYEVRSMNSKFDQFDMNEEILRASGEWYKDKWNLQWKILHRYFQQKFNIKECCGY